MASPLGLFGGTFDPVHFGHLRLATELRDAFGLARVAFLPAGHPWQRTRAVCASGAQRLRMLELAIAGDPAFFVDDRELRRPGPTYSADTLREFRDECGPATPIVFLCGSDAFARIETWHQWESLFEMAHFAVASRGGEPPFDADRLESIPRSLRSRVTTNPGDMLATPAGRIMPFAMTPLTISSTALRALARARRSIRYLTPDPVVDFIHQHQPYGNPA